MTPGVCGRWKREVPNQADMSPSLNYYSAAHEKQSFHRLRAHSVRAACDGRLSTWRTGPRPGGTRLCQLPLQDTWDGSRFWCLLLVLHGGTQVFSGSGSSCLLVASFSSPLQYGFGWVVPLLLRPAPGRVQVPPIYLLSLVLWQFITDSRPDSALECSLTNWTPSRKSQQSLHDGKIMCSLSAP